MILGWKRTVAIVVVDTRNLSMLRDLPCCITALVMMAIICRFSVGAATGGKVRDEIINTSKEKNANIIVVGLPLTLRGKQSKQTEIVQNFIEKLTRLGNIPVVPVDERFSSIAAKKSLQQQGVKTGHEKGRVDETAAAIILQEYLDSQS